MNLADEITRQFKALLKGQRLTPRQRQLAAEIAADFALLYTNAASGAWAPERVKRQQALLNQQLAALKSMGLARASAIFYKAVRIAVGVVFDAVLPV